jgi:hypothetical protein
MARQVAIAVSMFCAMVPCSAAGVQIVVRASTTRTVSPPQTLRTCVDRWNQANMRGWGPTLANVSVRRLDARERAQLGLRNQRRPRCAVSLAVGAPRDPKTGCAGEEVMPGHPKFCVYARTTQICLINIVGAYECSRIADGGSPLRNKNATTDTRGVLKLDVPLSGTHPAPSLAWQRYPHVDGFIEPWAGKGELRRGLTLSDFARHYRGICIRDSEHMHDRSALRCFSRPQFFQFDPCFAPTANWNQRGVVVACGAPGWTTFTRFVVSRHS